MNDEQIWTLLIVAVVIVAAVLWTTDGLYYQRYPVARLFDEAKMQGVKLDWQTLTNRLARSDNEKAELNAIRQERGIKLMTIRERWAWQRARDKR